MTLLRCLALGATAAFLHPANAQDKPTLYLVPYAHLDTQWRWSYPQVIREFLWNTMEDNFRLFDKYPDYTFNFGGSRRFELMREYFPEEYAKVVDAVKKGRWFPAPASVDETECNVLSGESVVRNVLYGNLYSKREFGTTSEEFMRPDSFGFPWSLPTLLAHAGIKGFSTQKLSWGSAVGVPFNVGTWTGPDGSRVLAALNATSYGSDVDGDLSRDKDWIARLAKDPVPVDYRYYGTGDRGGAPRESSVANGSISVKGDGPLRIVQSGADRMFRDLSAAQVARLPDYRGELLLTQHSAGSLTSHAEMKRWNRQNERLADLAERSSVAASLVAGLPYPLERLNKAWDLTLGSQMHDMLPGTCLPKAYEYAQNDETVAAKTFSSVATGAVAAVASRMDTRSRGASLVVVNPLGIARDDVVEAWVPEPKGLLVPQVVGPDGRVVPTQQTDTGNGRWKVAFRAKVPANGFAVFDVRATVPFGQLTDLREEGRTIENARFKVTLNAAGDLASVYDKVNKKEALKRPSGLDLQRENPNEWPAWNMDWDDQKKPPYATVGGTAKITLEEIGPVRSTLRVERVSHGSRFVRHVSLTQGGDRVEIRDDVDWSTRETALKASFPLSTANARATYGMQVGAIERPNDHPKAYEVPLHGWMDLTAPDGKYGVGVLTTDKFGADKPSDDTLRLTLVYTPGTHGGYEDQGVQDFGRHSILTALAPHAGGWREGGVAWNALRLGQPLRAFTVPTHAGPLGRSFSLASVSSPAVETMAVKKAEDGDGWIVRLRELTGRPVASVRLSFMGGVASAEEVDGQERALGEATVQGGAVVASLKGFGLRAYRVRPVVARASLPANRGVALTLPYDLDVVSTRAHDGDGEMGGGRSYAAETLPASLALDGISFTLGSSADGAKNALAARGQSLSVPAGTNRVELLVASTEDVWVRFGVGRTTVTRSVPAWDGYVGQWDTRLWKGAQPELAYGWELPWDGLAPGYVRAGDLAWAGGHLHHRGKGDGLYEYAYLYRVALDLPRGTSSVSLPNDPRVRVFAATAVQGGFTAEAAMPLMETLADHVPGGTPTVVSTPDAEGNGATVTIVPPLYWRGGELRYTLDGTAPTAASSVYAGPFPVSKTLVVRAREAAGPEVSTRVEASDRVAPRVVSATALWEDGIVTVRFSERMPVNSLGAGGRFQVGEMSPSSVVLRDSGRAATLTFAGPLPADAKLVVRGASDLAGNALPSTPVAVSDLAPVFSAPSAPRGAVGVYETGTVTSGKAPWTINLWLYLDRQPEDLTLIGGFGSARDGVRGTGRYLAKFRDGLRFWSAAEDVTTNAPLAVGRWQMLTATYDGATVRVYQDGKPVGSRAARLADDVSTARVLPPDAWGHGHRAEGEVQRFTLWSQALPQAAVARLFSKGRG